MRIAHITDYYLPRLGGIEMQVHDLATRQLDAGHDVTVITSTPGGRDEPDGPPVRRATENLPFAAALHPAAPWAGRRLVRDGKYDVLHVHAGPFSPLSFAGLALAAELPTVVTVHSLISYMEPAFRLLDGVSRWSALPAVWTAVSDAAAEPVRRLVAPRPVFVLPNGIDAARWRVEPAPREPGEVLVVAVMRLARRKRPLQLVRMLRRAHDLLAPRVRLRAVIAGDGPERRAVERHLRRHDMDWVSLPGRVDRAHIRDLFRRADLFVAPAMLESFGIAALEARCAGVPVVARAEGGIREFVGHGEEGLLVDSDDAMVEAIVRLAADADLRGRVAARSRTVPPPVTWPDVLALTEDMYGRAAVRLHGRAERSA
ncbi:GDP-mannose-dependent alpha-(1-2)-phosphatidylinositol mannosyltransferase [Actinomadura rubteroloni]|uniref:GDP-mannose-dependent alpha-(1-2)-phosphatidylinositol mannosyltransferase n=1 Tax=Actinomadura rubteroloni TaxID=1926885 RepID=A0A2P4UNT8_9ACTN|nr:glycosyltransferase family 4 protein [Actinomadura rubteroloni]POM26713.1 GDP-mannose-dependent alpha-(1-2)-phosphatidylinositol mannosyltransferase [Actinomadura rubteroloni]